MDKGTKAKRIRSFVLIGILIALAIAAGVIWWFYYCNKAYVSGAVASVDGTIRVNQPGTRAELDQQSGGTPASVISDNAETDTRIGLTFLGLSDDAETNAAVVQLVKEHGLKATLAISATDAIEHQEAVQAFLDAGVQIISNGATGESNLQNQSQEDILASLSTSKESLSAGFGRTVSLLYCSSTELTSTILRAAQVSGYQAVVDPEAKNVLDDYSFSQEQAAKDYVTGLHGSTVVVVSLRGPVQPIQYEPPIAIQKPAIDKKPDLQTTPAVELPSLTMQVQWLVDALDAQQKETEYVSNFPLISGLTLLKERVQASESPLALVYHSALTSENLAGIGISGLPATQDVSAVLSLLKENRTTATFFITAQEAGSRTTDIRKLVSAGCNIGVALPAQALDGLSSVQVFDLLNKNLQSFSSLPGYVQLVLAEDSSSMSALRKSAEQLGVTLVQPDSPDPPVPGALYLFSDPEEITALRKSAPELELLNIASVLERSGSISVPSSSAINTLRSENGGVLSSAEHSLHTTARHSGLAFYGLTNTTAAEDAARRLAEHGACGTFFVTLSELTANPTTIEAILESGNELGIYYRVTADYPQTFRAVASYLSSWKAYAQWRYGTASQCVFLRVDTVEEETLEAIHASGCRVTVGSIQPLKKLDKDIQEVAAEQLEALGTLRIQRGAFVFFDLNYFSADAHAQVGSTLLGDALDGFFREAVDSVAYRSQETGEIADDSRFAITPLSQLYSVPGQYSFCTETQTDIALDKNVLTDLPSDDARFQLIRQRYFGNVDVRGSAKLPGFTGTELSQLDRKGTFTDDPVLFLTFDDWGTEQSINPLLYVLEKHGVKATFFIRTGYVDDNPNLLRSIAEQGHQIACHTDQHLPLADALDEKEKRMTSLTEEEALTLREDLVTAYNKLYRYTGDVVVDGKSALSRMFRPPTLAVSKLGLSQVFDVGYDYSISGDYSTGDYEASSYADMLQRLTRRSIGGSQYATVHKGSVIVMHMQENAKYTAQALDEMIPVWRAQGYSFARIDDYLGE